MLALPIAGRDDISHFGGCSQNVGLVWSNAQRARLTTTKPSGDDIGNALAYWWRGKINEQVEAKQGEIEQLATTKPSEIKWAMHCCPGVISGGKVEIFKSKPRVSEKRTKNMGGARRGRNMLLRLCSNRSVNQQPPRLTPWHIACMRARRAGILRVPHHLHALLA